ncbi:FAD-linked oxidase [Streptomyces venezuelae]|uniref:FAD-linked oxidase n=1 Tax=Streptomyces venezuelae TaxID=54571 RepID=A0A5P2D313_STRVZ|nr:FAD-binding protein [Streptomyces venezuelae]QES47509.1 FAD-linked oxidase [Streptomyces venezuelae]
MIRNHPASTRRGFLGSTAAVGAGVAAGTVLGAGPAAATTAAATTAAGAAAATDTATYIGKDSPQYGDLTRGVNQRWTGTPEWVCVPHSTAQVVAAVQKALDSGKRPSVRGGGHCFEDFVDNADVRALIDLSALDTITYDGARRAISVGAGATLGEINEQLFKRWGIAIPGGSCPTVGVGGHVSGGGYGPLNRTHGLTVDHLYAVEVVVADATGTARAVIATREPDDPRRDLWWAHTGGGGGNFGIVTRYWFRTPGLSGRTPQTSLPQPPAELLVGTVLWRWADLDERSFVRLVKNYSAWHAAHNGADDPQRDLYSHLATFHRSGGAVALNVQLSTAAGPDPEGRFDAFIAAVGAGVGARGTTVERRRLPWLLATQWSGFADRPSGKRIKGKSAYHRTAFDDAQAAALHRHLTRADYDHPGSGVLIAPYGGRVNTVAPDATALVHRDSALILMYVSEWTDPAQDARHIGFQREFYEDVYAATGGAPVDTAGSGTAGAYVNYADVDLRDPSRNRSAQPWHQLYYGANYARLQEVKSRWDPRGVFRHALSVEPRAGRSPR